MCLFLVFLIKIIAQDKISEDAPTNEAAGPPFFLDLAYNFSVKYNNISDCLQVRTVNSEFNLSGTSMIIPGLHQNN
jgi:hypothetical protein